MFLYQVKAIHPNKDPYFTMKPKKSARKKIIKCFPLVCWWDSDFYILLNLGGETADPLCRSKVSIVEDVFHWGIRKLRANFGMLAKTYVFSCFAFYISNFVLIYIKTLRSCYQGLLTIPFKHWLVYGVNSTS